MCVVFVSKSNKFEKVDNKSSRDLYHFFIEIYRPSQTDVSPISSFLHGSQFHQQFKHSHNYVIRVQIGSFTLLLCYMAYSTKLYFLNRGTIVWKHESKSWWMLVKLAKMYHQHLRIHSDVSRIINKLLCQTLISVSYLISAKTGFIF